MTVRQVTGIVAAVIVGAALFVPSSAAAQGVQAGVKVGFDVANADLKWPDGSLSFNAESRTGVTIGGFMAKDFTEKMGLMIEGLYSQKGTTVSFSEAGFSFKSELKIDYIEVPVLARVNLKGSEQATVHLFGGPVFGFKVAESSKDTEGGVTTESDQDNVKGQDVAFAIGAGVDVGRFIIDARYAWGLMNINNSSGSDEPEVKTRTFTMLFGYNFGQR